jgi:uncharacterized membrane protein YkvA (DUF1232 family)/predicted RNA-binding Zn-ribbon protein involved in translation (DUF1610 family)
MAEALDTGIWAKVVRVFKRDPDVYAEHYSEEGFWDKCAGALKSAGAHVLQKALWLYYALENPKTPAWAKAVIYGALGYFILPLDLAPDPIYADDAAVLAAAVAAVAMYIDKRVRRAADSKLRDWGITPPGDDSASEADDNVGDSDDSEDADDADLTVTCPVTKDEIPVSNEDDTYVCPDCEADIEVEDGEATHAPMTSVRCRTSREIIPVPAEDDTYTCPDCEEDIDVVKGKAAHA